MAHVSISHLLCFVLVVFSVNVLVLAYLTGALSGMDTVVSHFTSSLTQRLQEMNQQQQRRRLANAIPPWERANQVQNSVPRVFGQAPFPACTSGTFWEHAQVKYCREPEQGKWTSLSREGMSATFVEVSFYPEREEVVLYDAKERAATVLKRSVAFKSSGGEERDEALGNVYDNLHLKGGKWTIKSSAAGGGVMQSKPKEQPQQRIDPDVDCSEYWFKPGDDAAAAFCKTKNMWVEITPRTGLVQFTFPIQLFHERAARGVGLFDPSRMIVVVLLETYCLIAHPASVSQALQAAVEADEIFMHGGIWRSSLAFARIPPQLSSKNAVREATLLVMISAFHDDLCANTVREAFENAAHPDRITIAIVDQVSEISCLELYCQEVGTEHCRRSQIQEIRVALPRSRGVMFARFLQQTLIRDEEFCLQIDSHMVFPRAWDEIAIEDWSSTENEMAVMTTYPNRALDRENQKYSPIRCNTVWNSHVVACGTSAHNIAHKQRVPHLTAFFGAGIAFSKCHANLVVPYDPWMAFLFKGEEYNRGARLWTHGYDLYAPKKNYAYHFYDDDPRPGRFANKSRDRSFFGSDVNSGVLLRQSELRWQAVMGMIKPDVAGSGAGAAKLLQEAHKKSTALREAALSDVEYFGLGTKRTLREFEAFSGINLAKHTAKDMCHLIGKMEWVPWDTRGHAIMGAHCLPSNAVVTRACCNTTMDRILLPSARTARYLNMTNDEFAASVRDSPVHEFAPGSTGPILSIGWTQAAPRVGCS